MECAVCRQANTADGLIVFSHAAYAQVVSILNMAIEQSAAQAIQEDSPIHVCRGCLQSPYQYGKR
jgi:hypothetical protein